MTGERSKRGHLSSERKRSRGSPPHSNSTLSDVPRTSPKGDESTQPMWPPQYVGGIQQLSPLLEQAYQRIRIRTRRYRRASDQGVKILSCISGIKVLSRLESSAKLKQQLRLHLKVRAKSTCSLRNIANTLTSCPWMCVLCTTAA